MRIEHVSPETGTRQKIYWPVGHITTASGYLRFDDQNRAHEAYCTRLCVTSLSSACSAKSLTHLSRALFVSFLIWSQTAKHIGSTDKHVPPPPDPPTPHRFAIGKVHVFMQWIVLGSRTCVFSVKKPIATTHSLFTRSPGQIGLSISIMHRYPANKRIRVYIGGQSQVEPTATPEHAPLNAQPTILPYPAPAKAVRRSGGICLRSRRPSPERARRDRGRIRRLRWQSGGPCRNRFRQLPGHR